MPEPIVVGYSGTRYGMRVLQYPAAAQVLSVGLWPVGEFHHGDCQGGDEEMHGMALTLGIPIVIHPPIKPEWRAWCQGAKLVLPSKPYLARNEDIVQAVDAMICTPLTESPDVPGSPGTWRTGMFARELKKPLILILPDGTMTWENMDKLP